MRYFLVVLALWLNFNSSAQLNGKYSFRHIDQNDGLLHGTVRGIVQDARGYMWILTMSGLQRYDGTRYLNFPQIAAASQGVMASSVLYVDTLTNKVCVIPNSTMYRLDPDTRKISMLKVQDIIAEDSNETPILFTHENGEQWLIGSKGVMQYDHSHKLLNTFFNRNPNQINQSVEVVSDKANGVIWLHNYSNVFICDLKTHKIQATNDAHLTHPLLIQLKEKLGNAVKYRYMCKDSYHNLWISTWDHHLCRYNLDSQKLFLYSLQQIKQNQNHTEHENLTLLVNAMYEDRQHNLWFATEYAGLLLYRHDTDQFDFITSDDKISNGLKYNFAIYSIFQDREDNIWIGTDQGISIFNPYRNYFQSIRHIDGLESSIPKQDIDDLIETKQGEILIATWGGGISIYDRQWNFIRNVHFPGTADYNLVWSFIQNENGTIWAGCQAGYIHIYDPIRHTFETIHPPELEYSTVRTMVKDRDGNILFGLHNGNIAKWNWKENKFYSGKEEIQKGSITKTPVANLFVDGDDRCWVSTDNGLFEFDVHAMTFKQGFQPQNGNESKVLRIQGIEEWNDSLLIIGAYYSGLFFFNRYTNEFSRPLTDEQLNAQTVYAIKKDPQGNVWFTTNYSLYSMSSENPRPVQFRLDNATIKSAFGIPRFYALPDGRWVTSTFAELICFDPQKMENFSSVNFKPQITGFKVFGKYWNIDTLISHQQPLRLPFDQNFISIEFASLDFSNIRETNYVYRLSTVDKSWIMANEKQFADYTALAPGDYTFEVKTENATKPTDVTYFTFSITPPWWGTLWFRLMSVFAIGILGYIGIRKRIQSFRHEADLKHQIAQTEMMALRSQMNPHFIFNCLNSIDNLIQTNQKEKATTYLSKFAQLIRAILENSKNNVIPFWKDLETLKLYLEMEALRWDNKIQYQLDIDPQVQHGDYKVPPMVIQPFVENAIHHGLLNKMEPDKNLNISVKLEGEQIKYTISDNGVGRVKAAAYKKLNRSSQNSFGLQISEDRISLFNQHQNQSIKITDLYDDQQEPAGTKVEVWLTTLPTTI